jgi:xylulokinase
MSPGYLGLDLGTSGLKAVLWSAEGALVAESEATYPLQRPNPGWAQTPVESWMAAARSSVLDLAPAIAHCPVEAIGIAGQMHGLVLVDDTGRALTPGLLWPDSRATLEAERWAGLSAPVRGRLANPLVPGMTGPLLAWLARHQPAVVDQATALLLPKDAVRAALIPGVVTDRSDASATLLWDVPADTWASDVMTELGLPTRLLPSVVPSSQPVGRTTWLKDLLGSGPDEVTVVTGGADTPTARLPLGDTGALHINLGTGAQVIRAAATPDPTHASGAHLYADTDDGWYAMVALQNAGLALDWVCDVLGMSWPELFAAATTAPIGSNGVLFRPYLTDERAPLPGHRLGAGWLGARADTTRHDLARAAVEAVIFTVAEAALHLGRPTGSPAPVLLTGGGGRPHMVRQLLADLLDQPVHFYRLRSASATGAAMLAAAGVGQQLTPQRPEVHEASPGPNAAATKVAHDRWNQAQR